MKYTIETASGSTYILDTDAKTILRRGGDHYVGRACGVAAKYLSISTPEVGRRLNVFWGNGRDEFSPDDGLADEPRLRSTVTNVVTSVEALP